MNLKPAHIHAARAARQFLTSPTRGSSDADYLEILRSLAPMRPPSYEFPGTPVCLFDRHESSDGASEKTVGERVRREGLVIKGRFQHGHIAYVPNDEMPLFIGAFRKTKSLGWDEETVLETLQREGPLQKKDLGEVCGIKGKLLTAALQHLQANFQVFEQQLETEWDNPWCAVETEHPDWLEGVPDQFEARLEVIKRFTHSHVFSSAQEVKDWSGFPGKDVTHMLEMLLKRGDLKRASVEGWGEHYLYNFNPSDFNPSDFNPSDFQDVPLESCVAILDSGDPLVTAQISYLKSDYPKMPVLKYILIDGEICGAVEGRWGIKAFDVTDVHLPKHAQKGKLKLEIIEKLRRHFPLPAQRILKFAGVTLDKV
jgi:Winged helix DNA-binding domain